MAKHGSWTSRLSLEPVASFFLATGLGSFTFCSQPCSGPCLEPRHSPGSRLGELQLTITCQPPGEADH